MTALLECEPALRRPDITGRSWAGRRVTVVGLGRSGVAAAELLCQVGARVRATDASHSADVKAAHASLLAMGVEDVEIGTHTRRMLEGAELVVVSPGVPESTGPIRWALETGTPIMSEIELAYFFCPSAIIAVTGTNGKSTAVTLIAEIAKASGRRAIACGNLGIPFSSVVTRLTPQAFAVVEVSSFQLLWCERFRPTIGLLLNIGTNHLDRHQDPAAYLAAKARLFQCQTPQDWAVLNGCDARIAALGERMHAQRVWFGENRSNAPGCWLTPETLEALTESAQAVVQVARILRIPDPLAWQVIRSFRGLEHRMEYVGASSGVRFINDSKSTTPDSLLFALSQTTGAVVVIMGGRDKGMDYGTLSAPLHNARVKGVVLIGESRPRLRSLFNGTPTVVERETLDEAVKAAAQLAPAGATVLFSPAAASFDMFRNFEDRGRAFKAIVLKLTGGDPSAAAGR